ncbi:hypothetical protein, variant 1 [Exophiala mesophila]|uniref:BZIP domain-containing protein n=1 Tax=Exophiala mesophila TaxID=212818 RepID=A0A0D1XJ00_EXOME|nr:hypothetical protein, variant 1 [Exophiala mesophila]KIV88161.1 hypothetical protein, variant 1 [Exophiala mesophila]
MRLPHTILFSSLFIALRLLSLFPIVTHPIFYVSVISTPTAARLDPISPVIPLAPYLRLCQARCIRLGRVEQAGMGSIANSDVTVSDAVVPKRELSIDGYSSDSASDAEIGDHIDGAADQASQGPAPAPKRKGGRKPIYATSEERKQRNRQAQAAFRERRTEYIKQLETTIQHHEENLQNLQQSHRAAADECLMLRYKNSLLERILLEKGIDVQAELALKGSPNLRPHRVPPITGQASPMQKAMLNRQQQARHRPVMAPPIQTVNPSSHAGGQRNFAGSPTAQPTPPSQHSSPSAARSPGFALQTGMTSPATDVGPSPAQQHHGRPIQPSQQAYNQQPRQHNRTVSHPGNVAPYPPRGQPNLSMQESYYPPSFQKHYSQLGKLTPFFYPLRACGALFVLD